MPRAKKQPTKDIDAAKLTPMSPCQAAQNLTNLKNLYESTELSTACYEAARLRIFRALALWKKEGKISNETED